VVPAGTCRPHRRRPSSGARRRHRPDAEFLLAPGDPVEQLLTEYEQACTLSRATATTFALDDAVPHPRMGEVSLRWIYVHMIEETARHADHADILRELIDGTTGL
jgi:hypothetical protein